MEMTLRYEETGEVRAPRAGEWFRGSRGFPVQAGFDFHHQTFPILRMSLEPASPSEPGAAPAISNEARGGGPDDTREGEGAG